MINVVETEHIFSLREHLILGATAWLCVKHNSFLYNRANTINLY